MSRIPYEPNGGLESTVGNISNGKLYTYRPLEILANLIMIFMSVLCLCYFSISAIETVGNSMFPNFSNPNAPTESDFESNLIYLSLGIALLNFLLVLCLAVFVCMFMYRANANVRSFGATGLTHTPGWCGGYWFVPILNLLRPYQAMKEIYLCSCSPSGTSWMSVVPLGLIPTWWGFWLIGGLVTQTESRLALRGIDTGELAVPLSWASTGLLITAGVLLIAIVRTISQRQTDWIAKLSGLLPKA